MAITFQTPGAIAYSAQNGTSVAPAYPASNAVGEKLILIIGMKPSTANSGSVTTPGSWNLVTSITGAGGYGTTLGADTGNTNLFVYERTVPAGGLSGSLTVTVGTNNVCWAFISRLTNTSGYIWDSVAGATGEDTTAGNVSIAFSSNPGVTANDLIIGAMCIPTDVTTPAQFSAQAFTQTSVTFGTVTEINEPDSGTGNDIGGFSCQALVSSGTGSANPTMTATAGGTTTNVRGPGVFIRIREVDNTKTLTGNSVNQPNTTTTGAVTQERNLTGTNCKTTPTTTTGAIETYEARYWVGGSGAWDASTTTHWSTTPGGGGGASVPTSISNVYFDGSSDSGSTFTVTVTATANCKNLTISGLDQSMILAGGSVTVNIYGNLDLPATNLTATITGYFYFKATNTGHTISTNDIALAPRFYFDGIGGEWTLSTNLTTTGGLNVVRGSFISANQTIRCDSFTSDTSGATRSIALGSSNVYINSVSASVIRISNESGLTFNAGTSNVEINANNCSYTFGAVTWYDIKLTRAASSSYYQQISGNITCHNFVILGIASATTTPLTIQLLTSCTAITCSGTFQITAGADRRCRTMFSQNSALANTSQVAISAATYDLNDCNIFGITFAGAGIPATGTSISDGGNCFNVTFTAPKTVYLKIGSIYWGSNSWTNTSGGTPNTDYYPLGQDTVIIDDATTGTSQELSFQATFCKLDASNRTSSFALTGGYNNCLGGNNGGLHFSSAITSSANSDLWFQGTGTSEITVPNNASYSFLIDVNQRAGSGAKLKLNNSSTWGNVWLFEGILDLNNNTLTTGKFTSDTATTRSLIFGTGKLSLSVTPALTLTSSLTVTYSTGASIDFTSASNLTLAGGGTSLPKINLAGAGGVTVTGANTFADVTNSVQPSSLTLPASTTTTFGAFSLRGTAGNLVVVKSSSTTLKATLSKTSGVVDCDYLNINDNAAGGGATWYAGSHSTDGLDNTGWIFTGAPITITGNNCQQVNQSTSGAVTKTQTLTGNNCQQNNQSTSSGIGFDNTRYWVGGTGNWDGTDTSHWSINSGGSGGASVPTSTLNVIFDVNSNTGTGSFTVTVQTAHANCLNYLVSTLDGAMTLSHNDKNIYVYGNLECPTTNYTHNSNIFGNVNLSKTSGSATIKWDAATTGCQIEILGGASYSLISNLTSGTFRVNKGSLDFANFNASIHELQSASFDTRSISLGNGVISIRNSLTFLYSGLTLTRGQSTIKMIGNGFNGNGYSFYYLENACTSGDVWVDGNNTFYDLKRSSANNGVGFQFKNGTTTTFENLTLRGTSGNLLKLGGEFDSYPWTISVASGIVSLDYLNLNYSTATGGATFYAGANSNNGGNNYNWNFTGPAFNLTGNNCNQPNTSTTGAVTKELVLTGNNVNQPNTSTTGAINRVLTLTGNSANQPNTSTTGRIARVQTITGNSVNQPNTTTTGQIARVQTLTGNNCNQPNRTSTGAITRSQTITGNNVNQPNTSTSGAINRVLTLTGNSVNQPNTSSTGAINRVLSITGNNCNQPNTSTTGAINRVLTLTGNNCQQVNKTTSASITQTHKLTGASCQQSNRSTSGGISQIHILTGANCQQSNRSTSGAINRVLTLTGNNCQQVNKSTSGGISQSHILTGANCNQPTTTTSGAINRVLTLTGNNVQQSNRSTSGAVVQTQTLTGNSVNQNNISTQGAISQTHLLAGNNVQQSNRSTTGSIGGTITLIGNSVNQPNSTTTGAINQVLTLTGNNVQQANQSTTGSIAQAHNIRGNHVRQLNQSTTGAVGQAGDLIGNSVTQHNRSTSGVITQTHKLTGADCQQVNQSNTGSISIEYVLTGNSVQQPNASSTGYVEQIHVLQGFNCNQFNRSTTGIVVVQGHLLGADCIQVNISTSDRIYAYPVENAPAGSAFNRYRFNPNRPTSSNTNRPDFINTQRPSNTNVIGPL